MTDSTAPVTPPPVAPEPQGAPTSALRANTFGLIAIILAALGFLMGVVPATSGFAWLLLLPAVILAIIGLTRKGQKKGTSIAALIVAVVGWIIAVIVASLTLLVGVGEAISENDSPPSVGSEPDPAPDGAEVSDEAAIGDTVTDENGVAFTVSAIACGIATAGPEFLTETARGQFCEVRFTVLNGSNEALYIFSTDVTGFIGAAEYESNGAVSLLGDDYFSTEINPGLSVDSVVYIDIPADAALDYIKYSPLDNFTGGVTVKAS